MLMVAAARLEETHSNAKLVADLRAAAKAEAENRALRRSGSAARRRLQMPLAIDLFCGLGGWADGLIAESYDVVGFDITQHVYGNHRYPAQLVLQDVLTLHGSQFRNAALIVASPPCVEYSYMAMPWKRAKQIAAALRGKADFPEGYKGSRTVDDLNALFDACFRIQREACEAAGRHIPLIVENVRGAQKWVGRARWNYGSFYLWGDVPALMPVTLRAAKNPGLNWSAYREPDYRTSGKGACFRDTAIKNNGGSWFNVAHNTTSGKGQNPDGRKVASLDGGRRTDIGKGARFTSRDCGDEGRKGGGDWFGSGEDCSVQRRAGSKSPARKAASAMIAKIPQPLARHIAATFKPKSEAA